MARGILFIFLWQNSYSHDVLRFTMSFPWLKEKWPALSRADCLLFDIFDAIAV